MDEQEVKRRMDAMELQMAALDEKRRLLLADHLALRAAFIAMAPLIASASTDQRATAEKAAAEALSSHLMMAGYSDDEAAKALTGLAEIFSEIGEPQNGARLMDS